MTDKVETFPQHKADQSAQKRIEAILEDPADITYRQRVEQIVDEFYPAMNTPEISKAINEWRERFSKEMSALDLMNAVVDKAMEQGDYATTGEAIAALA
jgi:hypothetical protein